LHIRPYKIAVVPEIKPVDYDKRVRFCNCFINHVHDGLLDPKPTFFTDEANFNLSVYVNSQNKQNPFFVDLPHAEEKFGYLMQGGVTPHTAKDSI
jgi:hypothetical protein